MKTSNYYNVPRSEILNFIPNNINNILDIGCGMGAFLNEVKAYRLFNPVGLGCGIKEMHVGVGKLIVLHTG